MFAETCHALPTDASFRRAGERKVPSENSSFREGIVGKHHRKIRVLERVLFDYGTVMVQKLML